VLASKGTARVPVRIALRDPRSARIAESGADQGTDEAVAEQIRNALALYGPLLEAGHVELRLHRTTLYSSLYRADDDLFVNQHAHGVADANAPVIHLHRAGRADMFSSYIDSLTQVWASAESPADPA